MSSIHLDGAIQFRFYSQDPSKYVWDFICVNGTTQTWDSCSEGFLDLFIPDTRAGNTGEEINLEGLPWHHIAEDLEIVTGTKFGGPVKYIWRGKGIFNRSF